MVDPEVVVSLSDDIVSASTWSSRSWYFFEIPSRLACADFSIFSPNVFSLFSISSMSFEIRSPAGVIAITFSVLRNLALLYKATTNRTRSRTKVPADKMNTLTSLSCCSARRFSSPVILCSCISAWSYRRFKKPRRTAFGSMVMENKRRENFCFFVKNWKGGWNMDLDTVTLFL